MTRVTEGLQDVTETPYLTSLSTHLSNQHYREKSNCLGKFVTVLTGLTVMAGFTLIFEKAINALLEDQLTSIGWSSSLVFAALASVYHITSTHALATQSRELTNKTFTKIQYACGILAVAAASTALVWLYTDFILDNTCSMTPYINCNTPNLSIKFLPSSTHNLDETCNHIPDCAKNRLGGLIGTNALAVAALGIVFLQGYVTLNAFAEQQRQEAIEV